MAPGDRGESRRAEPEAGVPFRARRIEAPHQEADTYRCRVRRVIDGDTLEVTVEVGFGVEVYQVLRLREIDAPELSERAGVRAREFVRQELEGCERVVIATRHKDKYGRWLADLYYHPGWRDGKRILSRGRWLNRELVCQGLAGRYGR